MKKELLVRFSNSGARVCYTQRELARKLGVKASHVAYLENGRRLPFVLSRIADTLGSTSGAVPARASGGALDRRRAREASPPSGARMRGASLREIGDAGASQGDAGSSSPEERDMLGRVSSPGQFLFILNSIRQAVEEDSPQRPFQFPLPAALRFL